MKYALKYYICLLSALTTWGFTIDLARANLFELSNYEAIFNLRIKIRNSGNSLAAFIRETPLNTGETDCLLRIGADLEGFDGQLNLVGVLVGLNARMLDPRDEHLVTLFASTEVPNFLKGLEYSRSTTNVSLARCSNSESVATKGKEVLSLYDEAASVVEPLVQTINKIAPR